MSTGRQALRGSWTFISLFGVVLLVWMGFNIAVAGRSQFDPYPFILLNLVLVMLGGHPGSDSHDEPASVGSRRIACGGRENDLSREPEGGELEIRHLHEKMDHILTRQWERLAEIQQIQLEIDAGGEVPLN